LATGTLIADSIRTAIAFNNPTVSQIQTKDGSWAVANLASIESYASLHVTFPAPPAPLKSGAGLQTFNVELRNTGDIFDYEVSAKLQLYEDGSWRSVSSELFRPQVSTSAMVSLTWDASNLVNISGSNVELRIEINLNTQTKGKNSGVTSGMDVGYVEWVYNAEDGDFPFQPSNITPVSGGKLLRRIYQH
jgi:hypothetical protein